MQSKQELLEAYRRMKTIREFEERVNKEFAAGNIPGFVHLYAGQEAVAVGVCMNLTDNDHIGSTHRGHGHCLAKDCSVEGMMKEIMAKADGLCKGKGGSMHIADLDKGMLGANAIVGGAPPIAVGAALTHKYTKSGNVSISFTGDGGSNQGTTFEAMNMAVVLNVPAIFVFENNGYGEGTHHDYAVGSKDIAGRAAGFGMPAEKVDGSDYFAVYELTKKMVERARKGEGPSAIEASITRFFGHFVGDPELYRGENEVKRLREELDCLPKFRQRVTGEGVITDAELNEVDEKVLERIENSVKEAMAAPMPGVEELETDVYVSY